MSEATEQGMEELSRALREKVLPAIYGQKMGFFLVAFPFGEGRRGADYISNAEREGAIEALRECADRLEKGETIPVAIGSA